MKKSIFISLVIIALLTFITGCGHQTVESLADSVSVSAIETVTNAAEPEIKYVYHTAEAKYAPDFIKSDLDELEKITSAVVRAKVLDSRPNPELDSNIPITLTTIHIDKVLKSDGTIKEEGGYALVEYYITQPDHDNPNIINVFSTNGALPLIINHEYLLFLRKPAQDYGDYSIAGSWQGKFPLTEEAIDNNFTNLTAEDMEFPAGVPLDNLWMISKQAYNKYLK